ncbi:dicarboxylate/amino acid:cation symporter [Marivivens donghaensis]|uniref:Dicarboxylate/amino acid:cation symporter n=1 Tax=Marivivens donghaensis TaxID=1699413 RepID=A0ABX0W112_9RHOB|nr:dicarboxylate/amino acid:cation symporter [Marivivens donghaensis]
MAFSFPKLLMNPIFILAVLVLAVVAGLNFPEFSLSLGQIGGYYISLLKMIVLPYLFVSITSGIARVVANPNSARYTW